MVPWCVFLVTAVFSLVRVCGLLLALKLGRGVLKILRVLCGALVRFFGDRCVLTLLSFCGLRIALCLVRYDVRRISGLCTISRYHTIEYIFLYMYDTATV